MKVTRRITRNKGRMLQMWYKFIGKSYFNDELSLIPDSLLKEMCLCLLNAYKTMEKPVRNIMGNTCHLLIFFLNALNESLDATKPINKEESLKQEIECRFFYLNM